MDVTLNLPGVGLGGVGGGGWRRLNSGNILGTLESGCPSSDSHSFTSKLDDLGQVAEWPGTSVAPGEEGGGENEPPGGCED